VQILSLRSSHVIIFSGKVEICFDKMNKILIVLLILSLLCGCLTDESATRSTLEKSGYTDIQIMGWGGLSCSDSDTFATEFQATNPRNETVSGVVCCGLLFKKCTIRF
jgi:hypothetical protein